MECWGFQSHLEKLSVVSFKTKIGVKQQFIRILVWFPNHFSFCGGSFWPWILIGPTIMAPFFRGSLVEFPLCMATFSKCMGLWLLYTPRMSS